LLCWGTAFETVHSLGDLEMDRRMGLRSIPVRIGTGRSLILVGLLHVSALSLLLIFGELAGLAWPYFVFVGAMAAAVAGVDLQLARHPDATATAFQAHFVLSALFLAGVVGALLVL
jgi:4-hydroxybenzoate polyprenyltransferase